MRQIQLIGHVGQDATIQIWSDREFVIFSVADTENYRDKDGVSHSKTEWYNVIYTRPNLARYLTKGRFVYIQGKPENRLFQRKDGTWAIDQTINASRVELLSSGKSEQQPEQQVRAHPSAAAPALVPDKDDDDLPF